MEILISNVSQKTLADALLSMERNEPGNIIVGYPTYDENGTLVNIRLRRQDEQTYGTEIGTASLIFGSAAPAFDIRIVRFVGSDETLEFIKAVVRNK